MAKGKSVLGGTCPLKELPAGPLREAIRLTAPEPRVPTILEELAIPAAVVSYKQAHKRWRVKAKEDFNQQVQEKMLLLMDHYEIDHSDVNKWQLLAQTLALMFVPGLQLKPKEAKKGAKSKWSNMQRAKLYCSVMIKNKSRAERRYSKSDRASCNILAKSEYWKDWGSGKVLYNQYLMAKESDMVKALDRMRDDPRYGKDIYSTFFEQMTGSTGDLRPFK